MPPKVNHKLIDWCNYLDTWGDDFYGFNRFLDLMENEHRRIYEVLVEGLGLVEPVIGD